MIPMLLKEMNLAKNHHDSPPNLHITDCRLVDGNDAAVGTSSSILIQGEQITHLGADADMAASEIKPYHINGSGLTAIPGMIDAHLHLVFDENVPSGDPASTMHELAGLSDKDLLIRSIATAQKNLNMGITTVRDCGDRNNCTLAVRDAINSGHLKGPRIVTCGMPITTTAGHCHWLGLTADTVDEVRRAVRLQVQSGVDAIKIMMTGGMMTPGSNSLQLQFNKKAAQTAVKEAHRLGKRVAAHIHAAEGMSVAYEAGIDTLEHCSWLSSDGTGYDRSVVDAIANSGQIASFTFSFFDFVLLKPEKEYSEELKKYKTTREQRYKVIRDMIEADIRYVINIDAGTPGSPHGSLALAAQVFVEQVGMKPLEAITAITKSSAEALGLEDEIGTIATGKKADITLVKGEPDLDIRALRNIEMVIKDGKIVVQNSYSGTVSN